MQSKLPMHLSQRCGARTRSESRCQSPAMSNGRCRMHGGRSRGPPKGNRNAQARALCRRGHCSPPGVRRAGTCDEGLSNLRSGNRIAGNKRSLCQPIKKLRLKVNEPKSAVAGGDHCSEGKPDAQWRANLCPGLQISLGISVKRVSLQIWGSGVRTTRDGSRQSGITAVSFSAILIRRAATASSITPPSDDRRPPSNAALSFLPRTAGNHNGSVVSSVMAGVAGSMGWIGLASTTKSYATSNA